MQILLLQRLLALVGSTSYTYIRGGRPASVLYYIDFLRELCEMASAPAHATGISYISDTGKTDCEGGMRRLDGKRARQHSIDGV